MKVNQIQTVINHRIDGLWEWITYLWLRPAETSLRPEVALKSVEPFSTKDETVRDAKELLKDLGILMNKNTKRKKADNPGAHQPRKTKKPKVGASAAEITRRIAKERS